jgi:hypothetical protein
MSTIVTRSGKGSPLTHNEVDANFTNLNTDKYQEGSAIGAVTPAAGTFTTLTATGQTSLGGAAGSDVVRVYRDNTIAGGTASFTAPAFALFPNQNNYGAAVFRSTGQLQITTGSAQPIILSTAATLGFSGTEQLRAAHTASAVNYVQVTGAATGGSSVISAQGSDTQQILTVLGRGTNGGVSLGSSASTYFRALGYSGVTAVNYLQVQGTDASRAPVLSVQGTDTNISQVFQSKGTGAIDLVAGSSGVNISNGGTVTAITRTVIGNNYTSALTAAISAPTTAGGVQATVNTFIFASTATLASGGTGYTLNDVLTVVGGTAQTVAATFTVTGVSGGVITSVSSLNFASYLTPPTNSASVTGGTGSGATLNVIYGFAGCIITNAGSGYVEQPTVTFSGGGGSGAAAYATVGSGTTVRSLGSTMSFNTPNGETFRVSDSGATASAYWNAIASGSNAILRGVGGASNVQVQSNSTGGILFGTNSGVAQLAVSHTASAVNYVQVTGGATGSPGIVTISSQGSDANTSLIFTNKGTGAFSWFNGGGTSSRLFRLNGGATNMANHLQIDAAAAGSAPTLSVGSLSSDTNVDLALTTKGTGAVRMNTGGGEQVRISQPNADTNNGFIELRGSTTTTNGNYITASSNLYVSSSSGNSVQFFTNGAANARQFQISHTASAVNYVQVTGSVTSPGAGSIPTISVQGSDASTYLGIGFKGTGGYVSFYNNGSPGAATTLFRVRSIAGTLANYISAYPAITGNAPFFGAEGGDTNIDLALTPKGTGNVRFGTYTASMALTVQGYIEIKDSGGTVRKLAVIA